ncbi:MAG TPA: ABC transporter transmembrane domain-containing protein [Marmoricola sp.]
MTTTVQHEQPRPRILGRRPPSGDVRKAARLFRRFTLGHRVYVFGLILLLIESGTSVIEPWPVSYLIDYLQGSKPDLRQVGAPALLSSARWETILLLTVAIVLIAVINSAADSLTEICMAGGGRSLGYHLRVAMYSHLQRLPLAYHDKRRTGDVLTRVTGDVLVLEDFVVNSVSNILGSALVLLGSFAFVAYKSWKIALIALVAVPLLAVISNHFSRRIKRASKTQRDREGDLASTTQEMLTSIRLVQSYGRGTVDLEQFSGQTSASMHASLRAANIQAQFSFVIALVEALAISAVVWVGVWLFDRGALTIGTLVLFVLLLQNMFKPARKIVSEWYKVGRVFASVERIQDLLDREVVVQDLPDAIEAPRLEGRLAFDHVSFAYPVVHEDGSEPAHRPKVLDDITFAVAPGEVVGLVGHSGAGKSTIAQLVPRLYDADEGEILVDDLPVRRLTLASLRAQVSVVLQETVLLSGTVAQNIGYGIAGATQEDIEAAARMANAHDFILDLPQGYETVLGERGSTLSGGQRQRIAIARAFIRRAPILILDEPTTGLDAESANSVVGALRKLMRGTTTIVISHDPGLVRCADRVLVISGGRIVEQGTHDELLRRGGVYAELFARGEVEEVVPTAGRGRHRRGAPRTRTDDDLLTGLERRLPGLRKALDPAFFAPQLQRLLADGPVDGDRVEVGKLWLRADGTCDLRYHLPPGPSPDSDATALARLHPDERAAAALAARLRSRQQRTTARQPVRPRRRPPVMVAREARMSLSLFPIDPDLPTLAEAMDAQTLSRLPTFSDRGEPVVSVAHHSRQGRCVLQYEWRPPTGQSREASAASVYGKVYADRTGDVVHGFLHSLAGLAGREHGSASTAFPPPVLYDQRLRLLLTAALPGDPAVPRLLAAACTGACAEGGVPDLDELSDAVRRSGRALAVLHGSELASAPVRSVAAEIDDVRHELAVVAPIWPAVAARVEPELDLLARRLPEPARLVLSHGDFTPSQVLLDGESPAMVDLDTLCWADPGLDLGRYLAHLHLKVRRNGVAGVQLTSDRLTAAFLEGYAAGGDRQAAAAAATDRIAAYEAITLARSALRSCRQLKPDRFELAMSLLEEIRRRRGDL